METIPVRIAIGVLSLAGLTISVLFALLSRGALMPNSAILPRVCRMEESSCVSILESKEARLFGIPNFVMGIFFYTLLLLWVFAGSIAEWFPALFMAMTGLSVVTGAYLAWALLFRLRVPCVLCMTSHLLNLGLFLLMVIP